MAPPGNTELFHFKKRLRLGYFRRRVWAPWERSQSPLNFFFEFNCLFPLVVTKPHTPPGRVSNRWLSSDWQWPEISSEHCDSLITRHKYREKARGRTQRHAEGAKVRIFVRNPDELANERAELARLLNKAGTRFLHGTSLSTASDWKNYKVPKNGDRLHVEKGRKQAKKGKIREPNGYTETDFVIATHSGGTSAFPFF
jgi:hypothetical protein